MVGEIMVFITKRRKRTRTRRGTRRRYIHTIHLRMYCSEEHILETVILNKVGLSDAIFASELQNVNT